MHHAILAPQKILLCSTGLFPSQDLKRLTHNLHLKPDTKLYIVHPRKKPRAGKEVYHSICEVLEDIDLAILRLPAKDLLPALRECGEQGIRSVIILGTTKSVSPISNKLRQQITAIGSCYGLHILGPRSGGALDTFGTNASIFPTPKQGNFSIISQSLHRTEEILLQAKRYQIGFSKIFTLGERAGMTENEILLYLDQDPNTKNIIICLESLADRKNFLRLTKLVSQRKRIIVMPTGTLEGMRFAKSNQFHAISIHGAFTATSMPELVRLMEIMAQLKS